VVHGEARKVAKYQRILATIFNSVLSEIDWDKAFNLCTVSASVEKQAEPPEDALGAFAHQSVTARLQVLEQALATMYEDAAQFHTMYLRVRFDRDIIDPIIGRAGARAAEIAGTRAEDLRSVMLKVWHDIGGPYGSPQSFETAVKKTWPALAKKKAEMVAHTEWRWAAETAKHEVFRRQSNAAVAWINMGDNRVCPICRQNSAKGPVPIPPDQFSPGEFLSTWKTDSMIPHPPAHPMCRCNTVAIRSLPGLPAEQPPAAPAPAPAPAPPKAPPGWTPEEWEAFNAAFDAEVERSGTDFKTQNQASGFYFNVVRAVDKTLLQGEYAELFWGKLTDFHPSGVYIYLNEIAGPDYAEALFKIPGLIRVDPEIFKSYADLFYSRLPKGQLNKLCRIVHACSQRLLESRETNLTFYAFSRGLGVDKVVIGYPTPERAADAAAGFRGYIVRAQVAREHVHFYGLNPAQERTFIVIKDDSVTALREWTKLQPVSDFLPPAPEVMFTDAFASATEIRIWDEKRVENIDMENFLRKAVEADEGLLKELEPNFDEEMKKRIISPRDRNDAIERAVLFKRLVQLKVSRAWGNLVGDLKRHRTALRYLSQWVRAKYDSRNLEQTLFDLTRQLIHEWAITSMEDPRARFIQQCLAEEFNVPAFWPKQPYSEQEIIWSLKQSIERGGPTEKDIESMKFLVRKFLRAQWIETQKLLDKVTDKPYILLTRGMTLPKELVAAEHNVLQYLDYQPISSFSLNPRVCKEFAGTTIVSAGVHRSRILSCFMSGFGCTNEEEFVVIAPRTKMLGWARPVTEEQVDSLMIVDEAKEEWKRYYKPGIDQRRKEIREALERWRKGETHPTDLRLIQGLGEEIIEKAGLEIVDETIRIKYTCEALVGLVAESRQDTEEAQYLIQQLYSVDQSKMVNAWREKLFPILKEHRKFGGKLPANVRASRETRAVLEEVKDLLPADWWEAIEKAGGLYVTHTPHYGGSYIPMTRTIIAHPGLECIIHELGHAVEFSSPQVHTAISSLWQRKISLPTAKAREIQVIHEGKPLTVKVINGEIWPNPYYGRDYGTGYTEILSMGLEQILVGLTVEPFADIDLLRTIIGVLGGI